MGIHRDFKLKMKLFYLSIIFGIASGCSRVSSEEEEFVTTWGDTTTLQSTILDEATVDSTTGGIEEETTTSKKLPPRGRRPLYPSVPGTCG